MRKGLTLLEVVIAGLVMTILLGALSSLLLMARGLHGAAANRLANMQKMQVTFARMEADLRESRTDRIFKGTDPYYLILASARDLSGRYVTDSEGLPVWQKWILYRYDSDDQVLTRLEFPYREISNITNVWVYNTLIKPLRNMAGSVLARRMSYWRAYVNDSGLVDLHLSVKEGEQDQQGIDIDAIANPAP